MLFGDFESLMQRCKDSREDPEALTGLVSDFRRRVLCASQAERAALYDSAFAAIRIGCYADRVAWLIPFMGQDIGLCDDFFSSGEICDVYAAYLYAAQLAVTSDKSKRRRRKLLRRVVFKIARWYVLHLRQVATHCEMGTAVRIFCVPEPRPEEVAALMTSLKTEAVESTVRWVTSQRAVYRDATAYLADVLGETHESGTSGALHARVASVTSILVKRVMYKLPAGVVPLTQLPSRLSAELRNGRCPVLERGVLPEMQVRAIAPSCTYDEAVLHSLCRASSHVAADSETRRLRQTRHGLLPVGLKIHCLRGMPSAESYLIRGGFQAHRAWQCFNLPTVGSAEAAIELLRRLEEKEGISFLQNDEFQIQVCNPQRLLQREAALLGVAYYLGSDVLKWFGKDAFETTHEVTGRRLVIYGANVLDTDFPFYTDDQAARVVSLGSRCRCRTDVLAATSAVDIANVNLVATLMVHKDSHGLHRESGERFAEEMTALLEAHELAGVLNAPWVQIGQQGRYHAFVEALDELMTYAHEEALRIEHARRDGKATPGGILFAVRDLLGAYREEVEWRARKELT